VKKRLDQLLFDRGLAPTREKARSLVMAGAVTVNGVVEDKPGSKVDEASALEVLSGPRYVSRGGLKLEKALEEFGLDVSDKVAIDVGASTGGFTDCLLQHGAARVYAVDVGYGQLDWKLRSDPRVVVMERTNARYLKELPEPADLATMDLSFISMTLAVPPVARLLRDGGAVVSLVKPQFEAGKGQVGRGGVVRDPAVHRSVLSDLARWGELEGYGFRALAVSPIRGPAGNVEFLALIAPGEPNAPDIQAQIDSVLERVSEI
jgi:23S rRNA (cytidine1920-2'-O)/16S rRNA (cytidine1409-2'-O)-methyltransferase